MGKIQTCIMFYIIIYKNNITRPKTTAFSKKNKWPYPQARLPFAKVFLPEFFPSPFHPPPWCGCHELEHRWCAKGRGVHFRMVWNKSTIYWKVGSSEPRPLDLDDLKKNAPWVTWVFNVVNLEILRQKLFLHCIWVCIKRIPPKITMRDWLYVQEKSVQALWYVIRPGYMIALFLLGWAANVALFHRHSIDYGAVSWWYLAWSRAMKILERHGSGKSNVAHDSQLSTRSAEERHSTETYQKPTILRPWTLRYVSIFCSVQSNMFTSFVGPKWSKKHLVSVSGLWLYNSMILRHQWEFFSCKKSHGSLALAAVGRGSELFLSPLSALEPQPFAQPFASLSWKHQLFLLSNLQKKVNG